MKFKNIIGEFSFENNELKLLKKYNSISDYDNSKLQKLSESDDKSVKKILTKLNNPEFRKEFKRNNTLNTIMSLKSSIGKDILILQTSNSIDETNKTINLNMKRFLEWYGYFLPEAAKAYSDRALIKKVLSARREELMKELNIDEDESMGTIPKEADYNACLELAREIEKMHEYKEKQTLYLEIVMDDFCKNLKTVAGALIGAKLIALAGSLKQMAMSTASKIQLLGAEKALFRHLKTGAKSPKYGILHEHPMVMKSKQSDKGKVARALADKISLAVKLDYFKGEYKGEEILKELEEKFK